MFVNMFKITKKLSLMIGLSSLINLSAVSLDSVIELNNLLPNPFKVLRTILSGEQFDQTAISIHNCWDYQIMLSELQAARPNLTKQQWLDILQKCADLHDTAVMIESGSISLDCDIISLSDQEKCCLWLLSAVRPRCIMAPTGETVLQISLMTLRSFDARIFEFLENPVTGISQKHSRVNELLKVILQLSK